jgi:pimeloyl-ACP methyl ester carboxylesterase
MGGIALELEKAGYTVWAFDAPAHGKSGSKTTNLFEFAALVARLTRELGIKDLVVSHSFGSGASVFAFHQHPKLCPKQLSMITSPNRYADAFTEFGQMIGLTQKQLDFMFRLIKNRFGYSPDELVVAKWIDALPAANIQLLHAPEDKIIRFDRAEKIAAASNKVQLIPMPGAGHYRILWQEETMTTLLHPTAQLV